MEGTLSEMAPGEVLCTHVGEEEVPDLDENETLEADEDEICEECGMPLEECECDEEDEDDFDDEDLLDDDDEDEEDAPDVD